jgi:hypothetical protein
LAGCAAPLINLTWFHSAGKSLLICLTVDMYNEQAGNLPIGDLPAYFFRFILFV